MTTVIPQAKTEATADTISGTRRYVATPSKGMPLRPLSK